MDENKPKTLQQKLDEQKRQFLDGVPARLEKLSGHFTKLKTEQGDALLISEFHRETHSLAGTAGVFGFVELSEMARGLEICLTSLTKDGENLPDHISTIEKALNELKSVSPEF